MLALFNLGGREILLILAVCVLAPMAVLSFVFWIWMLIHAVTNKGLSDGEKVAWALVILFLHFIGALIYFFAGRPKAKTRRGWRNHLRLMSHAPVRSHHRCQPPRGGG